MMNIRTTILLVLDFQGGF